MFTSVSRCVTSFGAGQRPCPGEEFRAAFGRNERYGACADEKQEKGIGAFLRQCRSRQPAVRTATRVCGVLKMALIIELRMCFGAILCKNARQSRVCKAFGRRGHTRKEV